MTTATEKSSKATSNMLSIEEFVNLGLLQEVNRIFFHPRGLALAIGVTSTGEHVIMGVRDHRDSGVGVIFNPDNPVDEEKYKLAEELLINRQTARRERFGWTVEPLPASMIAFQKKHNELEALNQEDR